MKRFTKPCKPVTPFDSDGCLVLVSGVVFAGMGTSSVRLGCGKRLVSSKIMGITSDVTDSLGSLGSSSKLEFIIKFL